MNKKTLEKQNLNEKKATKKIMKKIETIRLGRTMQTKKGAEFSDGNFASD